MILRHKLTVRSSLSPVFGIWQEYTVASVVRRPVMVSVFCVDELRPVWVTATALVITGEGTG